MNAPWFGLFLLVALPVSAQEENLFEGMSQLLSGNAEQSTPATWEGSQRLRNWVSTNTMTLKDSVRRSEFLQYRALGSLKHGQYDLAFADYELVAKLTPKSRGSIGWRYLFLLRDYPRALDYLTAFDELTPNYDDPIDDYSVNYLKGRAYAGMHQYENAVSAYTVAISNRETRYGIEWVDYRYYVARAVAYLLLSRATNALSDLEKALKNNPKSAMVHYHRGRALQQLDHLAEARDAFRDALFFVRSQPFERDYYYEQPDAAYEGQIEAALAELKSKP